MAGYCSKIRDRHFFIIIIIIIRRNVSVKKDALKNNWNNELRIILISKTFCNNKKTVTKLSTFYNTNFSMKVMKSPEYKNTNEKWNC